jgi:hypothetical protein
MVSVYNPIIMDATVNPAVIAPTIVTKDPEDSSSDSISEPASSVISLDNGPGWSVSRQSASKGQQSVEALKPAASEAQELL